MVCRWHMNKNVLSKTGKELGQTPVDCLAPGLSKYTNILQTDTFMAAFHEAVDSPTEFLRCAELKNRSSVLSAYLDAHWWKYKSRIVACLMNKYRHFGLRDRSVVEGAHANCKRWLQHNRGDLTQYSTVCCHGGHSPSDLQVLQPQQSQPRHHSCFKDTEP